MKNLFVRFVREEEGQDLIEYSLLAAIISLAAITVMPNVGASILAIFERIDTALQPTTP